jgi:AraC-like DNA-binding protein
MAKVSGLKVVGRSSHGARFSGSPFPRRNLFAIGYRRSTILQASLPRASFPLEAAITQLAVVSTKDVPSSEKFGLWKDTLWQLLGRLRSEASGPESFAGRIEHCDVGDLRICRIVARRHRVVRKLESRHDHQDLLKVAVQLKGTSYFEQNNRSCLLSPGSWSIYDTTQPYTVSTMGSVELLTLLIPRARIATHRLNLNDLIVRRFSGETGLGKLAFQFMTSAFAEIANVNPEHEWEIVGAISQLIRLAMLEAAGEPSDLSVRERWRERIKAHIDQHLRDPGLSLDRIAAAMNCSKRYVHKIFESEGTTTSEYIWRMRLCRCREELRDPAYARKSITEIAYSWGFNSSAHFSRTFKDAFHLSPRNYRNTDHVEVRADWLDLPRSARPGSSTGLGASRLLTSLKRLKTSASGI